MQVVLNALAPPFTLIVLGIIFRHRGFPGDAFWPPAVRLGYFVLLPAVLFRELATAPLADIGQFLPFALVLVGGVLIVAALTLAVRGLLRFDFRAFGSVLQGSIRFNNFVALATVPALAGAGSGPLVAVAIAALVPAVNVLSVVALTPHGAATRGYWRHIGGAVATNPLVLACVAGLVYNAVRLPLPFNLTGTIDLLGRAALPLGLLTVGAGLNLDTLKAGRRTLSPVVAACLLKLVVLPVVTALLCAAFGVSGGSRTVAVLFASLPTASTAYALARQMGGDADLIATIITAETVLAAVTLPAVWVVLAA